MKTKIIFAFAAYLYSSLAYAQGVQPVPDITGATVKTVVVDAGFGLLEYQYSIVNPASATGEIWLLEVDISAPERGGPTTTSSGSSSEGSFPVHGGAATAPMVPFVNLLSPFDGVKGTDILIVSQLAPSGWNGGVNRQAFAMFAAQDTSFVVTPGSTLGGYSILSERTPTIRKAFVEPHWIFELEEDVDHSSVTEEDVASAAGVLQSIPVETSVLGPSEIAPGGEPHFSQLSNDIFRARDIGWATDTVLVDGILNDVATAQTENRIGNNGLTQAALLSAIEAVETADPNTITDEFRDLVRINAETIISLLPTFNNTFIPVFTADPLSAELERDDTFVLTMRYFNSALEGNPPLEGLRILVRCLPDRVFTDDFDPNPTYFDCANSDLLIPGQAFRFDETGEIVFSYVGTNTGTDVIEVVQNDNEAFRRLAIVEVNWTAEADLVVPLFAPPLILASGSDTIFVTETTSNVGTSDIYTSSVTRYFISDTDHITAANIDSAAPLGERIIPPLAAGEISHALEQEFVIPSTFTADVHFLAACADAGEEVVESNEDNNCSYTEIERVFDVGAVIDDPSVSLPTISVSNSNGPEGDIGQQEFLFEVSLSASDSVSDISVDFDTESGTAVSGEDFVSTTVPVVFLAGTTELTQSVAVPVIGDFDVEIDESFSVQLTNASPNVEVVSATAIGVIENDDLASVTIGDISELEGNSGTTPFAFEISIDQPHPTESVSVNLQSFDGSAQAISDFNSSTATLTFAPGTTTLSQNTTVGVLGDLVVESDETFSLVIIGVSPNAVALDDVGVGTILNDDSPRELDCSPATASPSALWPPNHKLVGITIGGVLSESGDPAQITVTGIEQDEPVNGLGDGNTSPDGFGVGTDSPQVRRERSGQGDGRIYVISFNAIDSSSTAYCSGTVTVGVPHDQGQGSQPIDSGLRYDSTLP